VPSDLLRWAAFALLAAAAVCTIGSYFCMTSKRSGLDTLVRGTLQKRENYTSTGWTLVIWGRWLFWIGMGLFLVSILRSGGSGR